MKPCSLCEEACLSCDECRSTRLSIALCTFWRNGFQFNHGSGWVQYRRSPESILNARSLCSKLHEPGGRGWWNRQALRMCLMGSMFPTELPLKHQLANSEFSVLLLELLRCDHIPAFSETRLLDIQTLSPADQLRLSQLVHRDDVTHLLQKMKWSAEETDAFAKLYTLDKSHANWAIILEGIDPENPCLLRLRYFAERDGWPI